MTGTEHLRDLLRDAVLAPPDLTPAERAASVVRRGRAARRRDRTLGATGAAVVLLAAAVLPLALRGDDPADRTVDQPDPVPAAYTADPCPVEPVDVSAASSVSALPSGALSVRMCPVDDGAPLEWSPERAALMGERADRYLAQVAALAPYAGPTRCEVGGFFSHPWALRVTYPDRVETVGGLTSDCGSVRIGDTDVGANAVTWSFLDAMAAQQDGREGPGLPAHDFPAPACDAPIADTWDVMTAVSVEAVAGRVCADGVDTELTPEEIAVLQADFEPARGERRGAPCGGPAPERRVLLVDPWGDVTVFTSASCTNVFGSLDVNWVPSEAAARVIDDALRRR